MRYIDVNWQNDSPDCPYRLVSEIDDSQFETRKLEFFSSGAVGYASAQSNTENTFLGCIEVPDLEEINSQDEFSGKAISKQVFEKMWRQYAPHGS